MQVMSLIKNGSPEAPVSSQPHTCVSTLFKSNSRSLLITFALFPLLVSHYTPENGSRNDFDGHSYVGRYQLTKCH